MKKFGLVVFIILMVLAVTGCGKKSGLEGKVVDGKGKPMANVKIIAKQVQPIKGYEQFEATTGSEGTFGFKKLFPTSEYVLFPWFDDWSQAPQRTLKYKANKLTARFNKEGWTTEAKMKVQSGPEGQTIILASPMVIQPCISTVTGKLVDGLTRPMQGIKIVAKQVNPAPGYEQFEATTGPDGSFSFAKLYPNSKYLVILNSGNWTMDVTWTLKTSGEQELEAFKSPLTIRFIAASGVVTDTRTGFQWAAKDNGGDITWQNARSYCQGYKGGGYTDWRLPTQNELASLYDPEGKNRHGYHVTELIDISKYLVWGSETRGSEAARFSFDTGKRYWAPQSMVRDCRALPVRSGE